MQALRDDEWKHFPDQHCEDFGDSLKYSGLVNQRFLKAYVIRLALVGGEVHVGADLQLQVAVVLFQH